MIYGKDSLRWRGNALHLNSRPVLYLEPDGLSRHVADTNA